MIDKNRIGWMVIGRRTAPNGFKCTEAAGMPPAVFLTYAAAVRERDMLRAHFQVDVKFADDPDAMDMYYYEVAEVRRGVTPA